MLPDTLASLNELPNAREQLRARLPATATPSVLRSRKLSASDLDPREAYNDVPGYSPQNR